MNEPIERFLFLSGFDDGNKEFVNDNEYEGRDEEDDGVVEDDGVDSLLHAVFLRELRVELGVDRVVYLWVVGMIYHLLDMPNVDRIVKLFQSL